MEDSREMKVTRNRQYDCKKRRKVKHYTSTDQDYGVTSQKPDMDPEVYKQQEDAVLEGLKDNHRNRLAIAERTIDQSGNEESTRVRKKMVTGSNYGEILNFLSSFGKEVGLHHGAVWSYKRHAIRKGSRGRC